MVQSLPAGSQTSAPCFCSFVRLEGTVSVNPEVFLHDEEQCVGGVPRVAHVGQGMILHGKWAGVVLQDGCVGVKKT